MKDSARITLPDPEAAMATFESVADEVARARGGALQERRWLDRALGYAPGRTVLDLGCGAGRPIATYLADRRCAMTGIDGAATLCAHYQANVPGATVHHADMRGLGLGKRFDLILAWHSLVYLTPADQRAMFPVFAEHARPRTVLLFTTLASPGETVGKASGVPVYSAALSGEDYSDALAANGFELLAFVPDDPAFPGHAICLARFTGS